MTTGGDTPKNILPDLIAVIQMAHKADGMLTKEELNNGFEIGDWKVSPARGEMQCGDQIERPEPKVLDLLLLLATRDGDVVTKDELVAEIWGGRAMPDEPIVHCVYKLRGHFGDRAKPYTYVDTLPRRGYRLKKKVRLLEPSKPTVETPTGETQKTRRSLIIGIAAVAAAVMVIVPGMPGSVPITAALNQPAEGAAVTPERLPVPALDRSTTASAGEILPVSP